jgi:hypothetical protein
MSRLGQPSTLDSSITLMIVTRILSADPDNRYVLSETESAYANERAVELAYSVYDFVLTQASVIADQYTLLQSLQPKEVCNGSCGCCGNCG